MHTGTATRRARGVCDEGHGDQLPAELYQAPQPAVAPSGRAKRFRYASWAAYTDGVGTISG